MNNNPAKLVKNWFVFLDILLTACQKIVEWQREDEFRIGEN